MLAQLEWFETRLTVARWYLDAALSASPEAGAAHLQRARELERRLRVRVTECSLDEEQRRHLVRRLDELAARLIAVHRRE
jgi:hypothetical protein